MTSTIEVLSKRSPGTGKREFTTEGKTKVWNAERAQHYWKKIEVFEDAITNKSNFTPEVEAIVREAAQWMTVDELEPLKHISSISWGLSDKHDTTTSPRCLGVTSYDYDTDSISIDISTRENAIKKVSDPIHLAYVLRHELSHVKNFVNDRDGIRGLYTDRKRERKETGDVYESRRKFKRYNAQEELRVSNEDMDWVDRMSQSAPDATEYPNLTRFKIDNIIMPGILQYNETNQKVLDWMEFEDNAPVDEDYEEYLRQNPIPEGHKPKLINPDGSDFVEDDEIENLRKKTTWSDWGAWVLIPDDFQERRRRLAQATDLADELGDPMADFYIAVLSGSKLLEGFLDEDEADWDLSEEDDVLDKKKKKRIGDRRERQAETAGSATPGEGQEGLTRVWNATQGQHYWVKNEDVDNFFNRFESTFKPGEVEKFRDAIQYISADHLKYLDWVDEFEITRISRAERRRGGPQVDIGSAKGLTLGGETSVTYPDIDNMSDDYVDSHIDEIAASGKTMMVIPETLWAAPGGSRQVAQTLRHELDHVKSLNIYAEHGINFVRMGNRLRKTMDDLIATGDRNLTTMSDQDWGDLSSWHLMKYAEEVRAAENDKTWVTHHLYQEILRANKKGVTSETDPEYTMNLTSLVIVRDAAQQYIDTNKAQIKDAFEFEDSDIYAFVSQVNTVDETMGFDSEENQKMLADRAELERQSTASVRTVQTQPEPRIRFNSVEEDDDDDTAVTKFPLAAVATGAAAAVGAVATTVGDAIHGQVGEDEEEEEQRVEWSDWGKWVLDGKNAEERLERWNKLEEVVDEVNDPVGYSFILAIGHLVDGLGNFPSAKDVGDALESKPSEFPELVGNPKSIRKAFDHSPIERGLRISTQLGEVGIGVEFAITPEQQQQGLSGREKLDPCCGMLFVFDDGNKPRVFHMGRMNFPLDMICIDSTCVIVAIKENQWPDGSGGPIELPACQYVLEVNGQEAQSLGIRVGDKVNGIGRVDRYVDIPNISKAKEIPEETISVWTHREDGPWQHYNKTINTLEEKIENIRGMIKTAFEDWQEQLEPTGSYDEPDISEETQWRREEAVQILDLCDLEATMAEEELEESGDTKHDRMFNSLSDETGVKGVSVSAYDADRKIMRLETIAAAPKYIGGAAGPGARLMHLTAREWLKNSDWTSAEWSSLKHSEAFYRKIGAKQDPNRPEKFTWRREDVESYVSQHEKYLARAGGKGLKEHQVLNFSEDDDELDHFVVVATIRGNKEERGDIGNARGYDPSVAQAPIRHPNRYGGGGYKGQLVVQSKEDEQIECLSYKTRNFDICPKSVEIFNRLCSEYMDMAASEILEAVKLTDRYLGIEKRVLDSGMATGDDVKEMTETINASHLVVGEIGKIINEDLTNAFDYTINHFMVVLEKYRTQYASNNKMRSSHSSLLTPMV